MFKSYNDFTKSVVRELTDKFSYPQKVAEIAVDTFYRDAVKVFARIEEENYYKNPDYDGRTLDSGYTWLAAKAIDLQTKIALDYIHSLRCADLI